MDKDTAPASPAVEQPQEDAIVQALNRLSSKLAGIESALWVIARKNPNEFFSVMDSSEVAKMAEKGFAENPHLLQRIARDRNFHRQ